MKMQVEMFGTQLTRFIVSFKDYWKYKQDKEEKNYPDKLSFEEWVEQFLAFIELAEIAKPR